MDGPYEFFHKREKSRSWTEFLGEGGAEGSDGDHPDEASQRGDMVPAKP